MEPECLRSGFVLVQYWVLHCTLFHFEPSGIGNCLCGGEGEKDIESCRPFDFVEDLEALL